MLRESEKAKQHVAKLERKYNKGKALRNLGTQHIFHPFFFLPGFARRSIRPVKPSLKFFMRVYRLCASPKPLASENSL